jgi:hypothetical protein
MRAAVTLLVHHGLHQWHLVIAMHDDEPLGLCNRRNLEAFQKLPDLCFTPSQSIIVPTTRDIEPVRNVNNCKSVLSPRKKLVQKFTLLGVRLVQYVAT